MSKVSPIYSAKATARRVYHDNNQCTERNNIEQENIRHGTDGRPLCEHCKRLNDEGK